MITLQTLLPLITTSWRITTPTGAVNLRVVSFSLKTCFVFKISIQAFSRSVDFGRITLVCLLAAEGCQL